MLIALNWSRNHALFFTYSFQTTSKCWVKSNLFLFFGINLIECSVLRLVFPSFQGTESTEKNLSRHFYIVAGIIPFDYYLSLCTIFSVIFPRYVDKVLYEGTIANNDLWNKNVSIFIFKYASIRSVSNFHSRCNDQWY